MREIGREEVEKHCGGDSGSLWVVVHGLVIDVSDFVKKHKGGGGVLKSNGGKDISEIFDEIHSFDFIQKHVPHLIIGRIPHYNDGNKGNVVLSDFMRLICDIVGENGIECDFNKISRYSNDMSWNSGVRPLGVAFPRSTSQVKEILDKCIEYRVSIVPHCAGTSLEGNSIPNSKSSLTLSMASMNRILRISPQDMDCTVQAGVTYDSLNEKLRPHGLFFPVDPGPGAMIGGMVGCNASGPSALLYGTMRENVVSLEVVIPSSPFGETNRSSVLKTSQRARKSSAGYDMTRLFVGSEGTLGIITEITLRLRRIPEMISACQISFPSIENAASAATALLRSGLHIVKIELMDEVLMKAIKFGDRRMKTIEEPVLLLELSGSPAQLDEQKKKIEALIGHHNGHDLVYSQDPNKIKNIWKGRKMALINAKTLRPQAKVMITDVCVPIGHFSQCIKETKKDLSTSFLMAPIVGHAGDGNFHLFILVDPNNENEVKEAKRINNRLVSRAIAMNGTCTGEHGIGIGKKKFLPLELGDNTISLMRAIKHSIDPFNIMNPNKIFDFHPPSKL